MRKQLSAHLDHVITLLLLVVAGLTPLLFFNQTTEFFEMPKLIFLVIATVLLYGVWIFNSIIKGRVAVTRTPLDIPLLLLLLVILISTFFSQSHFAAIYGNFPKVHGSAVAWVAYILLYFVTVSHLRSLAQVRTLLYVLYGSAIAVAVITIASFFSVFLPFDFAKAVNFTPTGSSFSTIAFLLLLLPFPLLSLLNPNKYFPVPTALFVSILFTVAIALIGSLNSYIALLIAIALCVFVTKPEQIRKSIGLFLIPVVAVILTLILTYIPQMPGGLNKLAVNFPKEIQLPVDVSWKVSASAFRDAPFVGSGPSTYLFNFTSYKPLEFNALPYWNFSFDTASNEFLQVLGTLGILGLLFMVIICLVIINNSRKNFSQEQAPVPQENQPMAVEGGHSDTRVLLPALAISGLLTIVLFAIHATTLVSIVVSIFILAALMLSQKAIRSRVVMLSMGIKASTADNRQFDLFPILIFIVFLVGAVPALYKLYNVVLGDYYHRQALTQASQNGTLTYQYLQKAETYSPEVDLYRVDMAQTNFALANALATQKGPTANNPKGSLTDEDRKTIQTLISQAISESRASVALSPNSSRNWEVLASIYRNISGVAQNALVFSLDSYGRAIQRDPLNPNLRVNVGGIYYSIQNYDLAIRFFSDAANLKPDYANAYFNLAIALREKGDLQNAKTVADQTVKLLNKDTSTPDYKLAKQLLDDLNTKVAKNSGAPAAATSSALQNPELPDDVKDLNSNPPKVTPAPTVKPNPEAKLPGGINPTATPQR